MTFSAIIESDYLKFASVEETDKESLIDYTSTDFLGYKRNLLNYIKAVYPLDYNNFIESDLGVMLVELFAYIGATTSVKVDLLANENFIRTAKNRNNIKNLLELIGIRMKGPLSSVANAKLTFSLGPASEATDRLRIAIADRVVQITSPEDGGPLNFTLYKVVNGILEQANSNSDIILYPTEADDYVEGSPEDSTVFTNLVLLEGALVKQEGTFDSTQGIKSIELSKSPVIEGSVDVVITGATDSSGVYRSLDNVFFASGSSDRAFQIITDDQFRASVVFGDNIISKSPKGGDSYVITYRVGGGSRGNIKNELINSIVSYSNLDNIIIGTAPQAIIENVSQALGGSDAETVEHAKKYAPLAFRSQSRLVTLQDFKSLGNTFITSYGSIGKATAATRRAYSSANIIDMFILEKANDLQMKKATPNFKKELLEEIEPLKMLTDEVVIVDGLMRTVDLVITARVDQRYKNFEENIKLKIRTKILNYFNVDNRDFGETFVISDFLRYLYDIPEVRFITLDNIDKNIHLEFNEILQLNNLSISINLL